MKINNPHNLFLIVVQYTNYFIKLSSQNIVNILVMNIVNIFQILGYIFNFRAILSHRVSPFIRQRLLININIYKMAQKNTVVQLQNSPKFRSFFTTGSSVVRIKLAVC